MQRSLARTLLSMHSRVMKKSGKILQPGVQCFHLLGADVMLDRHGVPWLLEFNMDVNLHAGSPLDHRVKSRVLKEAFTMVSDVSSPILAFMHA